MRRRRLPRVLFVLWSVTTLGCAGRLDRGRAEEELLAAHERSLAAHRQGDWAWFGTETAEPFLLGNDGEFRRVSREDQRQRFRAYLGSVTFTEYADVEPPVVHVSDDGRTGWVIARVKIAGTANATGEPFETTFVWAMLYERRGDQWIRVANVSNRTPPSATLAAAHAWGTVPADLPEEARAILARAHAAMGGSEVLDTIDTLGSYASVLMAEGTNTTNVVTSVDGAVAFEQFGDRGRARLFLTDRAAWSVDDKGTVQPLSDPMKAFTRGHAFHHRLLDPTETLTFVEAIDPGSARDLTFAGVAADGLRFRDEYESTVDIFYDRGSGLPLGYVMDEPLAKERAPITVTVHDWQYFGPLRLFTRAHIEHRGRTFDYAFHRLEINQADPSLFDPPPAAPASPPPTTR